MKNYFCLEMGHFKLDGGAMFGIIPKPLWSKNYPADEKNRIDLALRLQVIQTESRCILVDTGIGDYHGEKFEHLFDVRQLSHPLEMALGQVGLKTSDITDLIISHLHFDHAGGIAKKKGSDFLPILKDATLHLHEEHYKYALNPSKKDAASFHKNIIKTMVKYYLEQGKLIFHTGSEGILFKGENSIRFLTTHGHTPHLMHPYDENFFYLSDLVPTSHHIPLPWVMSYDISPVITTEEKETILAFVEKNNLTVIYEHDPIFWGGKLKKTDKGIAVKESYKLPPEAPLGYFLK